MASQPIYTRGAWATALVQAIIGPNQQPGQVSVAFITGWTAAEYSADESKIASYNCLNMENGSDIAQWNPKTISSNSIVAFSRFIDGINATAARLNSGPYNAIVTAIQANDPHALGLNVLAGQIIFTTDSNNNWAPIQTVVKALGTWQKGFGHAPDQSYLNNIAYGFSDGATQLFGVAGDSTIGTASSGIFESTPGIGSTDTTGATNSISPTQVIKVLGGALMILAGVALLIKSLGAGTVQKVIGAK